jgi:hypothetical protein
MKACFALVCLELNCFPFSQSDLGIRLILTHVWSWPVTLLRSYTDFPEAGGILEHSKLVFLASLSKEQHISFKIKKEQHIGRRHGAAPVLALDTGEFQQNFNIRRRYLDVNGLFLAVDTEELRRRLPSVLLRPSASSGVPVVMGVDSWYIGWISAKLLIH